MRGPTTGGTDLGIGIVSDQGWQTREQPRGVIYRGGMAGDVQRRAGVKEITFGGWFRASNRERIRLGLLRGSGIGTLVIESPRLACWDQDAARQDFENGAQMREGHGRDSSAG